VAPDAGAGEPVVGVPATVEGAALELPFAELDPVDGGGWLDELVDGDGLVEGAEEVPVSGSTYC
jgi:hypothetical protein